MSTLSDEARGLFDGRCNCAQAVLAPFAARYGLSLADALRLAGGLGGGLRSGEVCGAATGGVLVVGLKYGQTKPDDAEAKQLCNQKTIEFMEAFRRRNRLMRCRELLGQDNTTAEGREAIKQLDLHHKVCMPLVAGAVELLEGLGY